MSVLRRNIYIVSRRLASSAMSSESPRDSFANGGSEFDDTEGDPPRGRAAPPQTITHWGLRVGRWIYNWVKIDSTKTIKFMRTPTTDAKWYTYFHVGTTSMGDGELSAAALEVGDARLTTYHAMENNCHMFVFHMLYRMDARSDILWWRIRERIGSKYMHKTYVLIGVLGAVTLGAMGAAVTGGAAAPFLLTMFGVGMCLQNS